MGTGIRFLPVEPLTETVRTSDEEVARIATAIGDMLGSLFTDTDGTTRPLRREDFMVVAPYNAQVRRLRAVSLRECASAPWISSRAGGASGVLLDGHLERRGRAS